MTYELENIALPDLQDTSKEGVENHLRTLNQAISEHDEAIRQRFSRAGFFVDVRDYGAIGDGVNDDTASIQSAIEAALTGSIIYFPIGTYVISNLTFVANVRLIGEMRIGSILKHKTASTDHMIEGSGDLDIENLTLNGNRENITSWGINVIDFGGSRLFVNNCTFTGSRRAAIDFDSDERVRIENCEFVDMQEHGGTTGQVTRAVYGAPTTSAQIWVLNNDFIHGTPADADSAPGGIIFSGSAASIQATGNYFKNIGQRKSNNFIGNIDFYTDCQDCIVTNNRIENYYYVAFKLSNTQKCLVANNIINGEADSSAEHAIGVTNARNTAEDMDDWIISNNIVKLNGNEHGIYVAGRAEATNPSSRINISDNVVYNTNDGIQVRFVSGQITLSGNVIDMCTRYGVHIQDTGGSVEISGGHINATSNVGIYARSNVSNLELNVSNVFFDSTTTYDISVRDATSLSVTGCKSVDTPTNPIDISNVTSVLFVGNQAENNVVIQGGANTNFLDYGNSWNHTENVETGTVTLNLFDISSLDSNGGAVTATLPDGLFIGQIKRIKMSDDTNPSTVSVTNHETSSPEVFTFDAVTDYLVLEWDGNAWVTIKNREVAT